MKPDPVLPRTRMAKNLPERKLRKKLASVVTRLPDFDDDEPVTLLWQSIVAIAHLRPAQGIRIYYGTFREKGKVKKQQMENNKKNAGVLELEKEKAHIIVEIVEYIPNAVISRTIIKKLSGNVTAMSFSEGEELSEKTIPFDTFIQIIDGAADVTIAKKAHHLKLGTGIIIPANALHRFNANQQFKMISTIIKSGYEDITL